MHILRTTALGLFTILSTSPFALAADFYVSPTGNDSNKGTKNSPLQTLDGARKAARPFAGKEKVTVHFAKGVYYLPQTVRFTAEDSGALGKPVIYAGEEGAIVSGGAALQLEWQPDSNGRYKAATPAGLEIDQLWIDGHREPMARFPNLEEGKNVFGAWPLEHRNDPDPAKIALDPARIAKWANPEGAYVHAMHTSLWGDMHWRVKGKKADGKLDLEGGWQNNRPSGMHPRYQMVENVFEELDAPGEWFHDRKQNVLYYQPADPAKLASAKVEVVRLPRLLSFEGTEAKPIKGILLKGFTFRHAARTFMDNKEQLLRSDWTICRDGAVFFEGAENCTIENCEFDQVGGNTIFVNHYNRRITVRGCNIHQSGANGVTFVGDPNAVRSPLFRYGSQNYEKLDRTPGPKSNNYPADCLVEDCLITLTGRDEKQTSPVQIEMAARITVKDCSIYDVPRAGINIGDGCWGGHLIEGCDIFNTVLETGDHGSFNSWGRDRFWDPSIGKVNQEVAKDPSLPFLDVRETITLRNNRWRCDHGWDIDLDDGSSNYLIENNLLLNRGLKLREGFKRIARNNVIINNSLHPHCWFDASGDIFSHNIVFTSYQPAGGMPSGKWGNTVDRNLFASSETDRVKFAKNGCDANSVTGDPLFLDPAKGDFRVKSGSPALKLGFKNFAMDRFGVKNPKLKALAKQPVISPITIKPDLGPAKVDSEKSLTWLGAKLRDISGEEFSAFGVSKESGGVMVAAIADPKAPAAAGDLRANDLIQALNGKSVRNLKELTEATKKQNKEWQVGIIRNQQPATLKIVTN